MVPTYQWQHIPSNPIEENGRNLGYQNLSSTAGMKADDTVFFVHNNNTTVPQQQMYSEQGSNETGSGVSKVHEKSPTQQGTAAVGVLATLSHTANRTNCTHNNNGSGKEDVQASSCKE
uniref:Phenylalanine--tRNA ligase beta subunit n=1 Tax=Lygus hesperus TaxID=30085 RepID=A0A0A9W2T2_LYGHE